MNRQYRALVLKPVGNIIAVVLVFIVGTSASPGKEPYLVKEPGVAVLAGIARVDSIGIDSTSGSLGPSWVVSIIHCALITSFGDPVPRAFTILSNAAAFSARDFPNKNVRPSALFSPMMITTDPKELCVSRMSNNAIWYKVGDTILVVAVQNPEGRITTHDVRYVRFLHSPLGNSDQKPMIQVGADTLKAAREFWRRSGNMTHKEIYALIEGRYKKDSQTLGEILGEMQGFYLKK